MEYDREAYRREKMRRLEAENEGLKSLNTQLIQMLALALEVATAKTGVSPTKLGAVIEEMVK